MTRLPQQPLNYLSLFSGIGGMDLGLDRAGMRCVGQVEIDPYCRKVLAKHWPDVPRFEDVRTFTKDLINERIDLIAGGFPCQDISLAGLREGINGERSGLWAEFFRIICEIRPRFALVENVSALLIPETDTDGIRAQAPIGRVLGDLASIGRNAEWDCFPAGAFGAHHLRDRVFVITASSDTICLRPQREWTPPKGPWARQQFEGLLSSETRLSISAGSSGGISDGLPNRRQRLHALGNAVVPQIAEWIGRRIMEARASA